MGVRALVLSAVALLVAGPVWAEAREIDEPPRPTTIAARGDVLAYSRWDEGIGAYRLRVAVGDQAPVDVPVAPRSVPFDVHVGQAREPGGTSRVVLVYSRCAKEPRGFPTLAPEQGCRLARGCSLRVAGLNGGERPIRGAGPGVMPGVSGTVLTFARFAPGRRPRLIVRPFDRPGRPTRVLHVGAGIPVDLDLLGRRLAITRRYQGRRDEVQDSAIDVVDVRTARRRLIHVRRGGGQTGHFIVGASLLPHGAVAWAEICGGDPGGCPNTELQLRWTPRGDLHSFELPGVEAFAATPFATWALQGCDPATYVELGPCLLSRFMSGA
jgi:hypothetical protein